jgi:NAD(P)-dependent dehydrogenase (short-subunit alcohol dehydrogenase family)
MIEVNVLGAIAWLNEAAVRFAATGTGTMLESARSRGTGGRRGQPVYCTSKAALETYLEALRKPRRAGRRPRRHGQTGTGRHADDARSG